MHCAQTKVKYHVLVFPLIYFYGTLTYQRVNAVIQLECICFISRFVSIFIHISKIYILHVRCSVMYVSRQPVKGQNLQKAQCYRQYIINLLQLKKAYIIPICILQASPVDQVSHQAICLEIQCLVSCLKNHFKGLRFTMLSSFLLQCTWHFKYLLNPQDDPITTDLLTRYITMCYIRSDLLQNNIRHP